MRMCNWIYFATIITVIEAAFTQNCVFDNINLNRKFISRYARFARHFIKSHFGQIFSGCWKIGTRKHLNCLRSKMYRRCWYITYTTIIKINVQSYIAVVKRVYKNKNNNNVIINDMAWINRTHTIGVDHY